MSPGAAADQHLASGQPMRLRLTGHTKLNGTLSRPDSDAQPAGPQQLAGSIFSGDHWQAEGTNTALLHCWSADKATGKPTVPAVRVAGDLSLEGVRINQLKLSRSLTGTLQVSDREVQVHAKVGGLPSAVVCVEVNITLVPLKPRVPSSCCRGSAQMSHSMWSWPYPCFRRSPRQLRPLWSSLCAGKTLWGLETSSLCHALVLAPLLHCHQVLTTLFVSACCLLFRLSVLEDLCWACRVHNDTSDLFSHCRQWGQGQPLLAEMRPAHYVCRGNSAV